MKAFDPEKVIDGKPSIASHFHPLIGPYDSSDGAVLEYQLLTMKLAGIDGVVVNCSNWRNRPTKKFSDSWMPEVRARRIGLTNVVNPSISTFPS